VIRPRRTLALALLLAGCSSRPQHPNPYVPPETQYSTGSTLLAAGGLMAAAVGSSIADSPSASQTTRTVGTATAATGVGLMLTSLIDAVEVRKQREKFFNLTRAFYRQYYFGGYSPIEESDRPSPSSIPELPFTFSDEGTLPPGEEDP
jgi:hypothetical protein